MGLDKNGDTTYEIRDLVGSCVTSTHNPRCVVGKNPGVVTYKNIGSGSRKTEECRRSIRRVLELR